MNKLVSLWKRLDYRWLLSGIAALAVTFGCGFFTGRHSTHVRSSFHDMIVNHPGELTSLVVPDDKRIRALAGSLKNFENAYLYVRDRIADDPSVPVLPAGEIIAEGKASCLGKAVVLCSLYRALGKPASEIRVVTGEADLPSGGFDHAWVELEHNGQCLQQDATNILGRFSFGQFRGSTYVDTFIRDEEVVFNDKHFAMISQLNRLKTTGHPPIQ